MPAATQEQHQAHIVDKKEGRIRQTCEGIQLKSEKGRDIIEGYIATKGVDKVNDVFTESALKDIAEDIRKNSGSVKVFFPRLKDVSEEKLENPNTNGNLMHNNNIKRGDPRIVSAFKLVDAEFDGFGVKAKAVLNTDGLPPETVDAVKNSIQQGFLNSFSVEWVTKDFRKEMRDGEEVRAITAADFKGAGLTGRPIQSRAKLTKADLKDMAAEVKSKTVAGVTFKGTKGGKLDESEIPNEGYASHYLFSADTKTESSYPVVDGDGFLRRGNVQAAHALGARGGVSEETLKRKLKALNDEFENPPIDFEDKSLDVKDRSDIDESSFRELMASLYEGLDVADVASVTDEWPWKGWDERELASIVGDLTDRSTGQVLESWNLSEKDINGESTVTEENQEAEVKSEGGEDSEEVKDEETQEQETKDFKEEVSELKDMVEEVKSENEELREENEELKDRLEDYEEFEEMKSSLSELKEEIKDIQPEDEPVADDNQNRMETESKSDFERHVEAFEDRLKSHDKAKADATARAIAEKHGKTIEEVKDYVN